MTGIITVNPYCSVRFKKLNGCFQSHLNRHGNECPDSCIVPRNMQCGKSHLLGLLKQSCRKQGILRPIMVSSSVTFHTSVLVIDLFHSGEKNHNKLYLPKFSYPELPREMCMVKYPMELCSINSDNPQ